MFCRKSETLFDPAGLQKERQALEAKTMEPDFWSDNAKAQEILRRKKFVDDRISAFAGLQKAMENLEFSMELWEMEPDGEVEAEISEQWDKFTKDVENFKIETLLDGEYDGNNAILSVHAGSGGTDAQDWAEMLYRMYSRYGEKKGYKVKLLDMQEDTEGGIKSATLLFEGLNAYGYLKNEKGVHRVVRISPFDSSGRRHTSFASIDVMPEIEDDLEVEIDSDDLRIDTFRSSGAGGQHVNTTDSAIRITHIPTNIVVSCQNERSQHQNREMAMKMLISKLVELKEQEHQDNIKNLQGDYSQITWGSQIRSYVFHPYTMVKDHRTGAEVGNVDKVMDGDLDYFINEKLKQR